MYRMIVSDLDETLLNSQHKVGSENLKWIKKAREKGVYFVPATGRIYAMISDILQDLALYNVEKEYVISGNGAMITENYQNKMLHFDGMPFEDMLGIMQFATTCDVCVELFTEDAVYVYNVNDYEQNILNQITGKFVYLDSADVSFLKDTPIVKILYMNRDTEYLKSLAPKMKHLTKDIEVSYSSNRYMEFNRKGVDKGKAVIWLANMLNIPIEEVIVCGDNYNDVAMLKVAGLSVAAQNAVSDVKNMCDVVTNADCNEGVLAEVIQKYIFSEE